LQKLPNYQYIGINFIDPQGGTSKEMLPLRYTSLPAFFVTNFYELRLATLETKIVDRFNFNREGLISLIHKGGTSKEMLPLRYTSLPAFFVTSFYELRLATLETKIVDSFNFNR
jgi:hypothetical protein